MRRHLLFSTSIMTALLAMNASAYAAKSPQDFIKDAIQGDNSEIMLGQLAQQKGGDQKTKDFGQTLVTDHTTAKQQAESVATSLGVTPPDQPTQEANDERSKLGTLSGADFDREFANYMVTDHQKDIQEFQDEAGSSKGPASDLAKQQLPVLKKHLSMAQSLASAVAQTNGSQSTASEPPPAQQNGTESLSSAPTKPAADEWRASKMAGVPIYGPDNEKVGAITDVLMSKDGKGEFVIVGVGGFLGIGQKDVAIPFQQVQFSDQPVSQNGSGGDASGSQPNASSTSSSGGDQNKSFPDHGAINMTADQLKSAPSFKFGQ